MKQFETFDELWLEPIQETTKYKLYLYRAHDGAVIDVDVFQKLDIPSREANIYTLSVQRLLSRIKEVDHRDSDPVEDHGA